MLIMLVATARLQSTHKKFQKRNKNQKGNLDATQGKGRP